MINGTSPCGTALPIDQGVWFGLLLPPIVAAILCLKIKATGAARGTSDSKWTRNASDRVAFFTWTAFGYAIWIFGMVYRYFYCR